MVCVHFLTPPEGTVLGFSLQGHAGCGEAGQDIVCAAVSSAAYLTVNTLTDVCRVTPLSLRVGEGEMFFRIEPKDEPRCRDAKPGGTVPQRPAGGLYGNLNPHVAERKTSHAENQYPAFRP